MADDLVSQLLQQYAPNAPPYAGFPSNYLEASRALGLSPQEQNLYAHHLSNLYSNGHVMQPDGGVSTVYQAVVGNGGRYYSIPTVWGGNILPVPQAVERALRHGGWDAWPSYPSPQAADERYGRMHGYMGDDTYRWLQTRNP